MRKIFVEVANHIKENIFHHKRRKPNKPKKNDQKQKDGDDNDVPNDDQEQDFARGAPIDILTQNINPLDDERLSNRLDNYFEFSQCDPFVRSLVKVPKAIQEQTKKEFIQRFNQGMKDH